MPDYNYIIFKTQLCYILQAVLLSKMNQLFESSVQLLQDCYCIVRIEANKVIHGKQVDSISWNYVRSNLWKRNICWNLIQTYFSYCFVNWTKSFVLVVRDIFFTVISKKYCRLLRLLAGSWNVILNWVCCHVMFLFAKLTVLLAKFLPENFLTMKRSVIAFEVMYFFGTERHTDRSRILTKDRS